MLCENCKKNPATVHFTSIVNNNKQEMYLCQQCADQLGNMEFNQTNAFDDVFSSLGIFGFMQPVKVKKVPVCNSCGFSYNDFQKSGKLGCEDCYGQFEELLLPVIKRLHRSTRHTGKTPKKVQAQSKLVNELDLLKSQLNEAIKTEAYEKAAELRDRIRSLEGGQSNGSK